MKDRLAEELLAKVLNWNPGDIAIERPLVQALAAYKYDEYQEFTAGSHFIENLALWLNQFETISERRIAYDFIKTRLVFCSSHELRHLVEMAYPDHIRPFLIQRAAVGSDRFRPKSVAARVEFKVLQRQCLFLGLSDGARIDAFRRANPELNHEQIWQTYELSSLRAGKLLEKLEEHLHGLLGRSVSQEERRFRTLVLLDDFSASGTSYFSPSAVAPTGGKILGFFRELCENDAISQLIDTKDVEVITLLYMATDQALDHIRQASEATWGTKKIPFRVEVVQRLPVDLSVKPTGSLDIVRLIDHAQYYDHEIFDRSFQKGGTQDARYGYAGCGLPLVLHHNTPNNSIALLMSYEYLRFRGLFPRIQRHREM